MNKLILTYNNTDYIIDLINDFRFSHSKKAGDVSDFSAVKSQIVKTFKVPKTPNNIKAFSFLGFVGSANYIAFNNVNAKFVEDGIEIISNGKLYANSKGAYYECVLKQGNGNFFDIIKGQSIKDIDFTDLLEIWSKTNIIAANVNTEGLIYPLIDWGTLSEHPQWIECEELFPALYLKTIVERIFDSTYNSVLDSDWNIAGEFLTNSYYTDAVIPFVDQLANDYVKNIHITSTQWVVSAAYIATDYLAVNLELSPTFTDMYLLLSNVSVTYPDGAQAVQTFKVRSDGVYRFVFNYQYVSISGSCDIEVHKNTYDADNLQFFDTLSSGESGSEVIEVELKADDFIFVTFQSNGGMGAGSDIVSGSMILSNADIKYTALEMHYPIAENLPDFDQEILLKELLQLFCMIPFTNTYSNTVTFEYFDKLYDNKANFGINDLTNNLDLSDELNNVNYIDNDFDFLQLGKVNKFIWAEDSKDNVREGLNDTYFETSANNYIGTKDFVKSIFATTQIVSPINTLIGNSYIFTLPKIQVLEYTETESGSGIYVVTRKNKFTPRILLITKEDVLVPLNYSDYSGKTPITTDLPVPLSIDFEDLKTDHYTNYIRCVNEPDTPTVNIIISISDFVNFDFIKPVFIRPLSAYYYCYEIPKFKSNSKTQLKLLKLK